MIPMKGKAKGDITFQSVNELHVPRQLSKSQNPKNPRIQELAFSLNGAKKGWLTMNIDLNVVNRPLEVNYYTNKVYEA